MKLVNKIVLYQVASHGYLVAAVDSNLFTISLLNFEYLFNRLQRFSIYLLILLYFIKMHCILLCILQVASHGYLVAAVEHRDGSACGTFSLLVLIDNNILLILLLINNLSIKLYCIQIYCIFYCVLYIIQMYFIVHFIRWLVTAT